MNTRKASITLGLVLTSIIILPAAHAAERNQASKLTFSRSVQIPGRVLPAGTYWFVLADTTGNRNVIHIFNSDRSMLYATIQTITAERLDPTDHTTITFAERDLMATNAIATWFYPGHASGHEFVYSDSERQELARDKHETEATGCPASAGNGKWRPSVNINGENACQRNESITVQRRRLPS